MRLGSRFLALCLCSGALGTASLWAQATPGPPRAADSALTLPPDYAGPPVPELPETGTRDDEGRVTIRAVRLATPLQVDGRLDEAIYRDVRPVRDFIQTEPHENVPATETTEVWVFFDRNNVYVSFRCGETEPDRMVLNEMRRDSFNLLQNEGVGFMLDTFYDKRNAVLFNVTPLGGRVDGQVTNERQYNPDWNPIWDAAVQRSETGWTAEVAVPFKSLRYRPGTEQFWGFNARRTNRWKNEMSYAAPIPNSIGQRGLFQASMAATVVGIEAPAGSRNLEIKPFAIGDLTTDRVSTPAREHDPGGNIGVDAKYGVTQSLTADLTYRTDFAQVEADEQQVNLTRFSLFFPEKREFFLENQGLFQFASSGIGGGGGGGRGGPGGGGGGGGGFGGGSGDTPVLFYSRRIGLAGALQVPVQGGGRLSGRVGKTSVGVLDIRTDDVESVATSVAATNFAVVRLKQDILRRSSIGAILTDRSVAVGGRGSNQAYGVDASLAFFTNLSVNTYWARTQTEGLAGDDQSYRAQLDYSGDRYGVQTDYLRVGDHFNPEVGFVRRDDMKRSFGQLRFSPRPASMPSIRRVIYSASADYIENGRGWLETRTLEGQFGLEFQNSDRVNVTFTDSFEALGAPFAIHPDVTLPPGAYHFDNVAVSYSPGQQHKVSGNVQLDLGTFYSGHKTTVAYSRGRVEMTPQLSVEPSFSVNRVDLAEGSFTSTLVGSRVTYTMTPLMFVSALVQYNASGHVASTNARLRWEYQPGSELFVVYNEERDTERLSALGTRNRSVVVKINRLFRF